MAHPHLQSTCAEPHHCSPTVRQQVLGLSPLTRDLPELQRDQLSKKLTSYSWAADELIFRAGDIPMGAYLLVAGRVRLTHDTAEGQELTVQIACPGDVLGSLHTHPVETNETATALETVCALFIPASQLESLIAEYPGLAIALVRLQQENLASIRAHEIALTTRTVAQRVAGALLQLDRKMGVGVQDGARLLQVKLRRSDIAGLAGTTVESASRTMARFKNEGLVESGREWVKILDRQALENI